MRSEFATLMLEAATQDKHLVIVVGDISHGILKPFSQAFPLRYFNIGICEPATIGVAAGLSKSGLIPVVHTIAPFMVERSFEQLKLEFEYQQQSVNLISVGSAFDYSKLGCSHHCYDDIALLRQFPSARIFVPGTSMEFRELFLNAYELSGINYFRLSEQQNRNSHSCGGGFKVIEPGTDLTLVALGTRLDDCLRAAELVKPQISVEVLFANQVKPLDMSLLIESVKKTRSLIVVEEHARIGGLSDLALSSVAGMQFRYANLGITEFLHQYGSFEDLLKSAGLDVKSIEAAIRKCLL